MSTHNKYYVDGEHRLAPELLRQEGPTITVSIAVPDALAERLRQQKVEVPDPQTGLALIDTGASLSVVDTAIIKTLAINAIGKKTVRTISGEAEVDTYPAKFSFPDTPLPDLDFNSVSASDRLKSQGYLALIGRDILQHGMFVYDGNGHYTLVLNPNQKVERGVIVHKDGTSRSPSVEIRAGDGGIKEDIKW
jgi:hypothetical protein